MTDTSMTSQCPSADWSIVGSAEPIAGLAGTLASVLFAVMALILTIPARRDVDGRRALARRVALRLLVPNFLVMFLASLMYAVMGGEQSCERASIMAIPASAVLATGALGIFIAITWALSAYVDDRLVTRAGILMCGAAWFIALVEIGLTIVNSARHLRTQAVGGVQGWQDLGALSVLSLATIVVVAIVATKVRKGRATSSRLVTGAGLASLFGKTSCCLISWRFDRLRIGSPSRHRCYSRCL
jgi:hypothetical protein